MQTETTTQTEHNQHTVKFHGTIGECFKIWFTNLFLIIITLGIYSFWAIIKMKRFFHQNTEINGYRFDFHAKPIQYAIGFFIAIAFYIAFIFLHFNFPRFALLLLLAALGALPWLMIKAIRFQMRMTSLNGVRFNFKGSIGTAYWVLLFLPLLLIFAVTIIFSLLFLLTSIGGFYHPSAAQIIFGGIIFILFIASFPIIFAIINIAQLEYFVNYSLFGQQSFQTSLQKGKMIAIHFITWLIQLPLVIWGMSIYVIASMDMITKTMYASRHSDMSRILMEFVHAIIPAVVLIFLGCLLGAIYRVVALRNYLFSRTTINGLQLKSTMQILLFFWLVISNLLIVIFTLGLCAPIAHIRFARYMASTTHIIGDFNIDAPSNNADDNNQMNTEPVVDAILNVL